MKKKIFSMMAIVMVAVMSCFSIKVEAKKDLDGSYETEAIGDEPEYEEKDKEGFMDEAAYVDAESQIYNTVGHYGSRPATYLFLTEEGYERVAWNNDYKVVVEKYGWDFTLTDSFAIDQKYIAPAGCATEDVLFGGVHEGEKYNFVLTGQYNEFESDDLNTIRVSKFSKDWTYISDCKISNNLDVEIYVPFRSGNMEFEELDGNLWISFARTGYASGDNLHHHGKQNIIIRESDMTLLGSAADFWHSFDQYMEVCNGQMYQMELSEGSRKVIVEDQNIENYTGGWNYNWASGCDELTSVFDFWSTDEYGVWSYSLYGGTGGFEASDANSKLLSVGYSVDQEILINEGQEAADGLSYNVWIASTTTDLSDTKFRWLTNYEDNGSVDADLPHIVKVNDDKFLVIWSEYSYDYDTWGSGFDNIKYMYVDSDGAPISDIKEMKGYLTENKPVVNAEGEIVWDAADGQKLYFFKILPDGTSKVIDLAYAGVGEAEGVSLLYRTHVQTYGDQEFVSDGMVSGTSGESKRLEAIYIDLEASESLDLGVQYTTHCQNYGWLPWSADGDMNGTEGESKRLEAIMIKLTGTDADKYDIYYRVHAQNYGWLGWAKNGEPAGTAGKSKRLEGIQIVVTNKDEDFNENVGDIVSDYSEAFYATPGNSPIVNYPATNNENPIVPGEDDVNVAYRTHVQTYGWQGWKYNGQMSGTSGESKRLEGIEINLTNKDYDGGIAYTTHVQTYGWQGSDLDDPTTWKTDGQMAGTHGESKRLEAICITLTGEIANHYDIYYRVHAQNFGWLDWAKNGEPAGTAGYSKRLEGIQVVIVPKGDGDPGNYKGITSTNSSAYIQK
ncbi:MAG: hypothetical protein J6A59_15560 [Lachnospiraceae bacterium]|nr:hypothetical protein [Lachnospiraceae bacterium]